MKPTNEEVWSALQKIVDNKDSKALNWAVNYAQTGIGMTGLWLRAQVPYVLSNITHWRGPVAKEVRKTLKDYVK